MEICETMTSYEGFCQVLLVLSLDLLYYFSLERGFPGSFGVRGGRGFLFPVEYFG